MASVLAKLKEAAWEAQPHLCLSKQHRVYLLCGGTGESTENPLLAEHVLLVTTITDKGLGLL